MGGRSGLREGADGVYQFAVLGAQVWLLVDEPVTLVDTGTRGGGPAIWRALERVGRRREDLATVVLTHYHPQPTSAHCPSCSPRGTHRCRWPSTPPRRPSLARQRGCPTRSRRGCS